MKKKLLAIFLSLCLMISSTIVLTTPASAFIVDEGDGWSYSNELVLTFSSDAGVAEWLVGLNYSESVREMIFESGVSSVDEVPPQRWGFLRLLKVCAKHKTCSC